MCFIIGCCWNTLKNAKFQKKIATLAKERACWSTTAPTICARASDQCRAMSVDRYLLSVLKKCIELLSIQGGWRFANCSQRLSRLLLVGHWEHLCWRDHVVCFMRYPHY